MANPFEDDMDEPKTSNFKSVTKKKPPTMQEEWNFYEQQIETTMQNTLDSTKRSMALLEESEAAGMKTAQQLAEQGEKLETAERRLDEIDKTTVETQKNLNNIKSVFGGIKNYFSRSSSSNKTPPARQSNLTSTVDRLQNTTADTSGFHAAETTSKSGKHAKGKANALPPPTGGSLNADSRKAIEGTRWAAMDDEIDENLEMMSANLRRLNDLGVALGDEVEQQNDLLDRIQPKVEKVDGVIRHQDKQMQQILGKPAKKSDPSLMEQAGAGPSMGTKAAMKTAKWTTGAGKFF